MITRLEEISEFTEKRLFIILVMRKQELLSLLDPSIISKIAGLKICKAYSLQYNCNFISAMPTNLYGPRDNFEINSGHVLPGLINKIHTAVKKNHKSVTLWGSGKPKREFLFIDDLCDALVFLMKNYNKNEHINIGSGQESSIYNLSLIHI